MKSFLLFAQLSLLLFIAIRVGVSDGAKILVLLPVAAKSDKIVFDPLIKALALNDHDVTVVSPVASRGLPISVKEIHPTTVEELGVALSGNGKDLFDTRKELQLKNHYIPILWNTSRVDKGCHSLYNDVEVKYLMKGLKRFDLAIVSGIQNECSLGLVYHFKVPHVYLTTTPAPNYMISRFGHYFPTSIVPSPYTTFEDRMTFPERTVNFIVETVLLLVAKLYLYPHYEEIYRNYVGEDAPGIDEIDDNVGVVLMNTNHITEHPRTLLTNIIEIGGLHCHSPRPLPTELDKFLSESSKGFIYISLGSLLRAQDVPESLLKLFINVFSKLEQKVIWKFDEEISKLPANVMTGRYLPEQDILGHRNIKLFISNGGMLSTQAAIYHGCPMIGIPLIAEHDINMKHAENAGYALSWELLDMNQTLLQDLIYMMLLMPQYKARAKHLSKVYRDMPEASLDKSLFWINYVLRNKGAPELRSAAKDLSYFEYHQIDVIAFLFSVILLMIYIIYCAISCVCPKTRSSFHSTAERNGPCGGDQRTIKCKCN